eukprot:Nk52_evm24s317 gene=Nk52_evmTU24s317
MIPSSNQQHVYTLTCPAFDRDGFCPAMEYQCFNFFPPKEIEEQLVKTENDDLFYYVPCPYLHGSPPVNGPGMQPSEGIISQLPFVDMEEDGLPGVKIWEVSDEYILKRVKRLGQRLAKSYPEEMSDIEFSRAVKLLGRYPVDEYNEVTLYRAQRERFFVSPQE